MPARSVRSHPRLVERFSRWGLSLPTPYKSKQRGKKPWLRWLVRKRCRIEATVGELVERLEQKVWTRGRRHMTSRS